ncbi:DUF438 domain-containing protein [Sediminicola luteus]|uniref:Histidine kinase n=1 Tax=Sediminicola luteus TaxID=319238 RepID=A0A2A4GEG6_9FLAO|nr:PAS domain-containing protein [Sediminicola luteus]PCE66185.1 histidine kinase [Sediminicola luteus]
MNSYLPTVENLENGHPVKVYYQESALIQKLILEITDVDPGEELQKYINIFNQLATIEKRFARKENQLFPYLEKHGWNGPSRNMWSFHDVLRDQIRLLREYLEQKDFDKLRTNTPYLVQGIGRLLTIEDQVLFPNAMSLLDETEWMEFYSGDEEIGWMIPKPEDPNKKKENYVHPADDHQIKAHQLNTDHTYHYDEGYMSPEQVNLLLRFLPVDITYVDENDRVIFYNRGEERVFPRSKGIIGREVQFCHPPKSVHMVLRIVEEFKAGTKDMAEFWFDYRGRKIHIRYFAIRDDNKTYKGVIEMSQDVTEIQQLEGQKRLLDWD